MYKLYVQWNLAKYDCIIFECLQAGLADIFAAVELWKISISIFLSLAAVVVSCVHLSISKPCGCCACVCIHFYCVYCMYFYKP